MSNSDNFPKELCYSKEDEWVRLTNDRATIGITFYAQEQLGDIVFVELPEPGTVLSAKETFGVIESVKAVSDLFSPISGEVIEINEALTERPELVNENCYGDGWMLVLRISEEKQHESLLTAVEYCTLLAEREQS